MSPRHLLRILTCAVVAVAAVVVPTTAAHAASAICQNPLITAYGPVQSCTLVQSSPAGRQGRAALHSPITDEYTYQTGWLAADGAPHHQGSDSDFLVVIAGPGLSTVYGAVAWGIELGPNNTGRFGYWSLITDDFAPTSGWLPRG